MRRFVVALALAGTFACRAQQTVPQQGASSAPVARPAPVDPTERRCREFLASLEEIVAALDLEEFDDEERWKLSDTERQALETSGVFFEEAEAGPDLVGLGRTLLFAQSLEETQLADVERFALKTEALPYAFVFARVFVERKRLESAARLLVASLREVPRPERASHCWRWWSVTFEHRVDLPGLTRDIAYAFLAVAEAGDDGAKEVVADLFEKERLDEAAITAIRERAAALAR